MRRIRGCVEGVSCFWIKGADEVSMILTVIYSFVCLQVVSLRFIRGELNSQWSSEETAVCENFSEPFIRHRIVPPKSRKPNK